MCASTPPPFPTPQLPERAGKAKSRDPETKSRDSVAESRQDEPQEAFGKTATRVRATKSRDGVIKSRGSATRSPPGTSPARSGMTQARDLFLTSRDRIKKSRGGATESRSLFQRPRTWRRQPGTRLHPSGTPASGAQGNASPQSRDASVGKTRHAVSIAWITAISSVRRGPRRPMKRRQPSPASAPAVPGHSGPGCAREPRRALQVREPEALSASCAPPLRCAPR